MSAISTQNSETEFEAACSRVPLSQSDVLAEQAEALLDAAAWPVVKDGGALALINGAIEVMSETDCLVGEARVEWPLLEAESGVSVVFDGLAARGEESFWSGQRGEALAFLKGALAFYRGAVGEPRIEDGEALLEGEAAEVWFVFCGEVDEVVGGEEAACYGARETAEAFAEGLRFARLWESR